MNASEIAGRVVSRAKWDQPLITELAERIIDRLEALPDGDPHRRRILELIGFGRARQLGYYDADVLWLSDEQLKVLMLGGKTPAELDELCAMLESLINPENR